MVRYIRDNVLLGQRVNNSWTVLAFAKERYDSGFILKSQSRPLLAFSNKGRFCFSISQR